MKKIIAVLLLVALMMFSMLACTKSQETNIPPAKSQEEPVANLEPDVVTFDFYANTDFLGNLQSSDTTCGAAVLAAKVNSLRAENPEGSAFFCLGDALSGTPIAALVQGRSVVEVYNAIPYDTFTLGNHEFDWGHEVLESTLQDFTLPVLCANITYKETGAPIEGTIPYVILVKNGVKIGVLGLTTEATPTIIRASYAEVLNFEDTTECANRYIPQMRAEGAEIVVIAGHLPMYEGEGGDKYAGELYDIAMNVGGVDALFGGHNDTLNTAEIINGVPVVKSAFYGNELSHISIQYDRASKTIVSSDCNTISIIDEVGTIEPDANIEAIVAKYAEEVDRIFDEKIGTASADIELDYFYECAITNWFANAVKDATGADMAFINPSGVFESVTAGDITLRKIYQMSPFENELVTTVMTGAQLHQLWETTLETERMPQYGTLAFAGLCITYDSTKEDGQKVISLTLPDGTEIKDTDEFTVSTLDFLAGGGNDYTLLASFEWAGTAIMMRDAYADSLREMGTLTPDLIGWMTDVSR